MKLNMVKFIPLMAAALVFTGCATTETGKDSNAASVTDAGSQASQSENTASSSRGGDARTSGARQGSGWAGNPLDDPAQLTSTRVIHFDFDHSEIQSSDRAVVVAHGEYLARNSSQTVTIEGHCDERGSREYNIALGERRANAVRQLLLAQGARSSQITTISYGEEQPVAMGSNESAWAENRRAVFAY